MLLLSTCCVLSAVIPTIEKLLNADWKEKLLDKSTVVAGQLKGQLLHSYGGLSSCLILFQLLSLTRDPKPVSI